MPMRFETLGFNPSRRVAHDELDLDIGMGGPQRIDDFDRGSSGACTPNTICTTPG